MYFKEDIIRPYKKLRALFSKLEEKDLIAIIPCHNNGAQNKCPSLLPSTSCRLMLKNVLANTETKFLICRDEGLLSPDWYVNATELTVE